MAYHALYQQFPDTPFTHEVFMDLESLTAKLKTIFSQQGDDELTLYVFSGERLAITDKTPHLCIGQERHCLVSLDPGEPSLDPEFPK